MSDNPVRELNAQQMRFAEEYVIDFNKTQAAIRAGYSPKTAGQQGYRLFKDAQIQTAIARLRAEQDEEYKHRVAQKYEVLARLTEIARADIGDLLPEGDDLENVSVKKAKELGKSHLIKKVRTRTTIITEGEQERQITETELELHDAQAALVTLGKHYQAFTENIDVTSGGKPLPVIYIPKPDEFATPEADSGSAKN